MAYDIGPKIGIEGEGEFRKNINNINTNMRTLKTEMESVASQFDKNDKSTEAYAAKNEVLNKQIGEQKNKLSELEKGLKASAEKYGENDKVTQGWQQAVNKANTDLNIMERELKDNKNAMTDFGKEADQSIEKTNRFSGAVSGLGKGLANVGKVTAKAAIAGIKAVGAASVAAAVGAFKLAKDVGQTADALITLSDQTGVSTQQLQEWQYAMRFIDVDVNTMTGSMAKLVKSIDDASKGSKSSEEAFDKLGVAFRDNVTGELRSSQDVFMDTIDALGQIENETERDAMAMRMFGKSAQELNPLIKAGTAELARLSEEAHKVGAVLSDEALKAAGKFDDMLETLGASSKGLVATLGVSVLPGVTEVVNSVIGVVPKITEAIKTGDWDSAGKAVSEGVNALLGKLTAALPGLSSMASTIIGGIAGALASAVPEVLPPLIDATLMLLDILLDVLIDNGPMLIDAGIKAILMITNGLINALPKIVSAAVMIILALTNGLINALPELIPMIPQIVTTIVDVLAQNLPLIIDAALQIIVALGIALVQNLPIILKSTAKIIGSIFSGLINGIGTIIGFVPKLFKSIFEAFANIKWGELGKNIIDGIKSGITGSAKELAGSVVDSAKNALSGAKKFLGISSPSKLFKNQIGLEIGAGMASGIADSAKQVNAAMNGLNKGLVADVSVNGIGGASANGLNNKSVKNVVEHTGIIRLEGINDYNQLRSVVNIVMDELRREVRMA
jgi:hypothetical protein